MQTNDDFDVTKSPAAWFAEMEIRASRGDFEGAAAARKKLEELGVKVEYKPKGNKGKRTA